MSSDENVKEIDSIWFKDPTILVNSKRLSQFYPFSNYPLENKLNAVTRFAIYLTVLLIMVTGRFIHIYLLIVVLIGTYIIYTFENTTPRVKSDEQIIEQLDPSVGTRDNVTINEHRDFCTKPTAENPMMNVLLSDYTNNPNRPPACNHDELYPEQYEQDHNTLTVFGKGPVTESVSDISGHGLNRQFYTMPSTTIPNDRESFLSFCYDDMNKTPDLTEDITLNEKTFHPNDKIRGRDAIAMYY